jgi:hypothetical protein
MGRGMRRGDRLRYTHGVQQDVWTLRRLLRQTGEYEGLPSGRHILHRCPGRGGTEENWRHGLHARLLRKIAGREGRGTGEQPVGDCSEGVGVVGRADHCTVPTLRAQYGEFVRGVPRLTALQQDLAKGIQNAGVRESQLSIGSDQQTGYVEGPVGGLLRVDEVECTSELFE